MMNGYVSIDELVYRFRYAMEKNLLRSKRLEKTVAKSLSENYRNRAIEIYMVSNEILGIDILEGADENLLKLLN